MNKKIKHVTGDHATKFNTPADYIRAYEKVMNSFNFKKFKKSSKIQDSVEIDMSNEFGSSFQSRITGYSANGVPTVFGPNTKIIAVFRKVDSDVKLITMYPDP
jgi:hypothetical protein